MKYVNSSEVPPFPFLSHGSISQNPTVYVAGVVGIVPGSNPPRVEGTAAEQTTRAMGYLKEELLAAGSDLAHLAMVGIFHTDPADGPTITAAYTEFFDSEGIETRPPRMAIGAAFLPLAASVEFIAIGEQLPISG